jgi:hypothetical protein
MIHFVSQEFESSIFFRYDGRDWSKPETVTTM